MDKLTKRKTEESQPDSAESSESCEPAEKPVSLHPLEFREAVRAVTAVKKKGTGNESKE